MTAHKEPSVANWLWSTIAGFKIQNFYFSAFLYVCLFVLIKF